MRGKLICFEGIDGSGKGSQIKRLMERMPDSVLFAYPDRSWEIGKAIQVFLKDKIRLSPVHQFFLYAADILKDQGRIERELELGKTVILDRYVISTVAYQAASGFEKERGLAIADELGFLKPDVTILLDISPKTSVERKKKQTGKLERFEKEKFLGKVRRNYLELARKRLVSKRWAVIDGEEEPERIGRNIETALGKTNVY